MKCDVYRSGVIALLLAALLSGCEIEGGRPEARSAAPSAAPLQDTVVAPNTNLAQRNDVWEIGLPEVPRDLYPYQINSLQQRVAAPVTELLFPAPVLVQNFSYTTTGVLTRLPSLENGDVVSRPAKVFLDAAGQITTTETQVITDVQQLEVTYRWNPALRWSDDTPLTADDSVFAYELARQDAPNDETRERLSQLVSYIKVDDHTTRAVLRPDLTGPGFVLNVWLPLPRHLLKDTPASQVRSSAFARQPVSYGPYQLVRATDGVIELERNPHYFGAASPVSRVRLSQIGNQEQLRGGILNGALDVALTDRADTRLYDQLAQDAQARTATVAFPVTPTWEHIVYNLDVPMLQDIRIRRALAFGTDRQEMSKAVFGSKAPVLDTWIVPAEPEAAPTGQLSLYGYSPDLANQLLDEAGYAERLPSGMRATSEGLTLTLTLVTTSNTPLRAQLAERFRQNMAALGIEIDVRAEPTEQLFDLGGPLYQRQFELALFGWSAGAEPGGLALWSCGAVPSQQNGFRGQNFAGWCFRDADRAIRRAVTATDVEERKAAYLTQQQLWTQELPAVPLLQRSAVAIIAPGVQNVQPDGTAPITWNITQWRRG